jgi:hypothetical protein
LGVAHELTVAAQERARGGFVIDDGLRIARTIEERQQQLRPAAARQRIEDFGRR